MDDHLCKVLIPACGKSERFKAVTKVPKGVLRFSWKRSHMTMIEHISSVLPERWPKWVVHRTDEAEDFRRRLPTEIGLIGTHVTNGQADTVFQALSMVNVGEDLIVLNCDNAIVDLTRSVRWFRNWNADCGAVTFEDPDRSGRYGYVDKYPHFTRGAEKEALSSFALAGAFYFKNKTVYERAFRAADRAHRPLRGPFTNYEIYISQLFEHIEGVKIASWIERAALHEWGSWQQLQDDPTVTIDWSRV